MHGGTGGEPLMLTDESHHKVTLMPDTPLQYPELWLEVYVVSHGDRMEERNFAQMFIKAKCTRAETPDTADLVVFVGGVDVNPEYYDEYPHPRTETPDRKRDEADLAVYNHCLEKGIPMLGVCRGAQFLHVMNGGKLYQHLDGHYGDHRMWDLKGRYILPKVSSVHHQACIPNRLGGMEILADAVGAHERWRNPDVCDRGTGPDVEAFFYRDTVCLGVQFHPEYSGYDEIAVWTLKAIEELIVDSPDTMNLNRYRRLKPEILAERNLQWEEATALTYSSMADDNTVESDSDSDLDDSMDGITEDQIARLDALGLDLPDDLDPSGIQEILREADELLKEQAKAKQQEAA